MKTDFVKNFIWREKGEKPINFMKMIRLHKSRNTTDKRKKMGKTNSKKEKQDWASFSSSTSIAILLYFAFFFPSHSRSLEDLSIPTLSVRLTLSLCLLI